LPGRRRIDPRAQFVRISLVEDCPIRQAVRAILQLDEYVRWQFGLVRTSADLALPALDLGTGAHLLFGLLRGFVTMTARNKNKTHPIGLATAPQRDGINLSTQFHGFRQLGHDLWPQPTHPIRRYRDAVEAHIAVSGFLVLSISSLPFGKLISFHRRLRAPSLGIGQ
jgi:hypothetical protein